MNSIIIVESRCSWLFSLVSVIGTWNILIIRYSDVQVLRCARTQRFGHLGIQVLV